MSTKRPVLPSIQTAPDAIQLEVFLLERPAEDPLLTTSIWKEVDTAGAVSSFESREILRKNGFRLGTVSSNPPPSVQKLLGLVAEIPMESSDHSKPLMGRHQYLSPGVETEVTTGIEHEICEVDVHDVDRSRHLTFERVGCVLRLKAQRLHDGWVRVDFQPEFHHGEQIMRRVATEGGMVLRGGQNIDVRHGQRFSVEMNVGEMALITSTSDDQTTMGNRFFCHSGAGSPRQRILVVKIVDAGKMTMASAR